jgi:hypothetical protein
MKMSFKDRIEHLVESCFQALYIATAERSRCEEELAMVAAKIGHLFVTWDGINGFTVWDNGEIQSTGDCKDPIEALLSMDDDSDNPMWRRKNALIVLRNFHTFLEDAGVRQQFQNLYYGRKLANKDCQHPVIILANAMQIHAEIAPCITVAEFQLPTEVELTEVFKDICDNIEIDEARPGAIATYDEELQGRVIQAMRGLTTLEAENTLAYSLRVNRGFAPSLVDTIEDQKALTIEKSEVLTYVPKERIASMDDIGGYEELKDFMAMRKLAYTKKARELNMDLPRGIVLLGVPGCISGNNVVEYKRGNRSSGCSRQLTVSEFHDKFNGLDYHGSPPWQNGLTTYLQSFDAETGRLFYNRVTGVYPKGRKRCVRIVTDVAGAVTLTTDHPVLMAEGIFAPAAEVNIGDVLLVRGSMLPQSSGLPRNKNRERIVVEGLRYHTYAWAKHVTDKNSGKVYTYQRTHRARLVLEARMNNLPYDEFVHILKTDAARAEELVYLDPMFEVHHINEDPVDDRIENLMVLTKAAHTKYHCDETRFNVEYTKQASVIAIDDAGEQETYDIAMDFPCSNFVVNAGIIVHNTGKSVVGKVIARDLGLPLVVLNVSAVFGSLVGESERRIRTALNTVDALDGAVALVDEAEKALGGASESTGDSGVSRRVFGVILTWLTEKTSRTFVVMTMNRTRGIPPEFLRKGRWTNVKPTLNCSNCWKPLKPLLLQRNW